MYMYMYICIYMYINLLDSRSRTSSCLTHTLHWVRISRIQCYKRGVCCLFRTFF